MEKLRVIGVEDDVLVLATETGERFGVPVDEVLRTQLRRADRSSAGSRTKASPRDIQAQIRAGLSAEETAAVLGLSVDDVVRFEAPVLAEREFVVGQALSVPVLLTSDFDSDTPTTFGDAVRAKLVEAHAVGERWSSWKDDSGWTVKLSFSITEVERDARWSFDPKRSVLSPINADATQLSRQGSLPDGLIPRLRALEIPGIKDDSRFDSGAFGPRALPDLEPEDAHEVEPLDHTPVAPPQSSPAVQHAAIKRAPEASVTSSETADLLEALRRRRGQRPDAPDVIAEVPRVAAAPVALFDAVEPGYDEAPAPVETPALPTSPPGGSDAQRRKGRTSMPSWDEIVFGARTDES
jgi:hypothetical protein